MRRARSLPRALSAAALALAACGGGGRTPGAPVGSEGTVEPQPGSGASSLRAGAEASVTLLCDAKGHAISPRIYGVAFADEDPSLGASAHRWGGNTTSRYNFVRGDVWNTANDWFFQNVTIDPWTVFLDKARARGGYAALTVPMIGWVAKDGASYSFSVRRAGPQQATDPQHPDKGNGTTPQGKPLAPPPPTETSVAVGPADVEAWVRRVVARDRRATAKMYILDNEPMLWSSTHRDVHPEPVGYDELVERSLAYAAAIKRADPQALVAGPAVWGWPAYFFSAKDAAAGFDKKPDRRAHGDKPLLEYYLAAMRAAEARGGRRLLDVLDVHFYPQADGVHSSDGVGAIDAQGAERRVRATRALWDESYVDESWIGDKVALLPRMKRIIDGHYPGTKLSIGEYSFAGETHVSGALALAEALGRFAQHDVYSAFYFERPPQGSPAWWAFRMFRSYDGAGGAFEGTFVATDTRGAATAFAAKDPATGRIKLVVVNAGSSATAVSVDASRCGPTQPGRAFFYAGGASGPGAAAALAGGAASMRATVWPRSISVLEIDARR